MLRGWTLLPVLAIRLLLQGYLSALPWGHSVTQESLLEALP